MKHRRPAGGAGEGNRVMWFIPEHRHERGFRPCIYAMSAAVITVPGLIVETERVAEVEPDRVWGHEALGGRIIGGAVLPADDTI